MTYALPESRYLSRHTAVRQVKWSLFGAMVTETAKEKARDALKNAISEKLGIGAAKPGAQKAEPKDQAREMLKGLFGR